MGLVLPFHSNPSAGQQTVGKIDSAKIHKEIKAAEEDGGKSFARLLHRGRVVLPGTIL